MNKHSWRLFKGASLLATGSVITYVATNEKWRPILVAEDPKVNRTERTSFRENREFEPTVKECQRQLEQWRASSCIPGAVIGVSVRGKTVWTQGIGLADIENNVACSKDTVMRIGSISKSIAASFLMKMVERKELELDVPIRKYLTAEEFPDKLWEGKKVDITLRQLAAHLGGIRHYKKDEDGKAPEFLMTTNFPTAIDSLKIFKDDPLVAEPGTKYVYTTYGWTLISAVMESRLEKRNFGEAFQKFIRTELGLKNTSLDKNLPLILNRSKYYFLKDGKLQNCPAVDNSSKWAGGGLVSNIGDLLQFGNLMLYSYRPNSLPGFFSRSQVEEMWNPLGPTLEKGKFSGYGIGWVTVKGGSAKVAFGPEAPFENYALHTGAAVGASTVLLIEPKDEIVVAIITNLQYAGGVYETAVKIAKEFSKSNL